jgi:WD40 repeat protein
MTVPASPDSHELPSAVQRLADLGGASLLALLLADQRRCWGRGQRVLAEVYCRHLPRLRQDDDLLFDLVWSEALLRQELGEMPSADEYAERFPHLAERLRRQFSLQGAVTGAGLPDPAGGSDLPERLQAVASMLSLLGVKEAAPEGSEAATLPPAVPPAGVAAAPEGGGETLPPAPRPEVPAGAGQTLSQSPEMLQRAAELSKAGADSLNIEGYRIIKELGRGGMGVVYQARHLRLGRVVALKMILAGGHASAKDLLRFLGEAEAVAALQHPHIVQLYEFGQHGGLPYFTLEFVAGGTLAGKLSGTPLAPREAARIVEQLARGMAYAHQRGIIHRDLKPGNVLLGQDGTPKITDFGLAKKVDTGGELTASGALVGTPSYMAPEQAGGKGKHVGPAADVYALGAILYECLTGRPPFKAATALDTVLQVIAAEPAAVRQLQPGVPADLETIAHKCLQKEQGQRYASALNLAEDLRRFQAGEPIQARPVGRLEWAWKLARRNPVVSVSVLTVAVALLAATVVSALFGFRAEQARQAEAEHAQSETTAKHEADQARREAQRQLIDLCGVTGLTAAREQDHSLALLWFARAAQLAGDEPQQEELNRIRIANWLRQVCLPEGTFAVPGFRQIQDRYRTFDFSPNGRYLLVLASTGDCIVWDRPRRQLVPLPGSAAKGSAAAWQPGSGLLAIAEKGAIRFLSPPDFRFVDEVIASGDVTVLAFSKDGKRLAWGGSDGARVWDQEKKAYLTPLLIHEGQVVSLSFSSDGRLLATAARDGKARVFRAPSEERGPLFPPVAHTLADDPHAHRGPAAVTPRFAAGDQTLLTVEETPQGARLMWRSPVTGKILSISNSPENGGLNAFAVSEGGQHVAVLWASKGQLWDAQTRRVLSIIPAPAPWIWNEHVTFSADGKTLVTCGHDTRVRFWSVDDRSGDTLTSSLPPVFHPMQAVRVDLTSDGRHLATALWDGTVCLWRLPAGVPTSYSVAAGGATLPAVSPDKRFVLPRGVSFRGGTQLDTRVYEAETGKAAGPTLDPGGILLDAAFSPDGKQVATASSTARTPTERNQRLFEPEGRGGNVQTWDWKTGKRIADPIPTPSEPRGLAFRPDGSTLAVVCADYRLVLINAKTGRITHHLDPGLRTRPQNANQWFSNGEARFSPDGRFLVTWEMTPHVHVWDPERGQLLYTLPHTERKQRVCFNTAAPNLLATCGLGGEARVWDLSTGKLVIALKHPQWVAQIQFAPDGRELITGSDDGLLRVWDWKSGQLKDGWPLHPSTVQDISFTADRRALVTIGHQELQVTDWRTKTPVSPLWNLKPNLNLAMEIPAGQSRVIVGGFSGSLVGYDLKTMVTPADAPMEELVHLAELAAGRRILSQGSVVPLNSAEWAERWQRLQPDSLRSIAAPSRSQVDQALARRLVEDALADLATDNPRRVQVRGAEADRSDGLLLDGNGSRVVYSIGRPDRGERAQLAAAGAGGQPRPAADIPRP